MKKWFLLIFSFSFLFAQEQLEVSLRTNKLLYPIYLSLIMKENPGFSADYINSIDKTIENDFENAGHFKILKREDSKNILLAHKDMNIAFDLSFWKKQKVRYVVKLVLVDKTLSFYVLDQLKNGYDRFSSITLSGDLPVDRKQIHKICDGFLQKYIQKIGIAQTSILYTVRKPNPNKDSIPWLSEVWMCDYDGENCRQITFENSYFVSPSLMPRAGSNYPDFVYVSYQRGIPKICHFQNGQKGEIVQLRGNQLLPCVSRQGDKIAFISDAAGRPDLFLQRLNGENKPLGKPWQLFSAPKATQATSSFSPDGEKLAFVSDKDGSPRIYIIKVPENEFYFKRPYAQLITKKNRYNVTPAWSSDGSKLAYCAKVDGTRQLWLYDFITDEEIQLTFDSGNKENPSWAKDNLHIVYNTEDKFVSELYIINLNTLNPVKISTGLGQKRFPVWCN